MKKLALSDLNPEMMKSLSELKSAEEIVAFCESKGFEISEKGAAKILDQFAKVSELTAESLEFVAGGSYGSSCS